MIVRKMLAPELDATFMLFNNYYKDELFEMKPSLHNEYDENSMVNTIRHYSVNYEYIWFNAYEGQRPVGFIAGYMTPLPWNHELIVANISYIYLLESHRNKQNFNMLMDEFKAWADLIKAVRIVATDCQIFENSFDQLGYKPVTIMTKEN